MIMKAKNVFLMLMVVLSHSLMGQGAFALSKDLLKSALEQADSEHEKAREAYRSHAASARPEDGRRNKTGRALRVRIIEDSYALSSSGQAFMAEVEDEKSQPAKRDVKKEAWADEQF